MFQNGVGCRRPQDTECPKGAPAPVATSLHGQPSRLVGPQAGPVAPAMPGFTSRPGGERGSTSCFSVKNSRKASDLGHLLLLGPVCAPSQPGLGHMTLPPLSHCEVTSRAMVVAGLPPAVIPSLACAQPHAGSPRFPPVFPPRASGPHKPGQPCFLSCHPLTCGAGLQGWTSLLFARRDEAGRLEPRGALGLQCGARAAPPGTNGPRSPHYNQVGTCFVNYEQL